MGNDTGETAPDVGAAFVLSSPCGLGGPWFRDERRRALFVMQVMIAAECRLHSQGGYAMQWYYGDKDDHQLGPVDDEQLKALIAQGVVGRDTPLWNESMEDWAPAGETAIAAELPADTPQAPPPMQAAPPQPTVVSDCLVYPSNPPLSPHMSLLSIITPGLGQVVFGKIWLGVTGIITSGILCYAIIFDYLRMEDPSVLYSLLNSALTIVMVIDGYMTGKVLRQGHPVGPWNIFPKPPVGGQQ
jgi:hypothetical protein